MGLKIRESEETGFEDGRDELKIYCCRSDG
jgi:hypothetical protein